MATKVHAQMIAIFAGNEHFVRLLSGETGTIARYREDTARKAAAEVNPYGFIHSALLRENFTRFSHCSPPALTTFVLHIFKFAR